MDSKIIALIAGSFLLTGCMAAKVDKLHTTTVQLSNDVDSYVKMTDKVVELNNQGFLYYSSNPYFTTYLRSYENSLTPNQKKELDKISFNTQFLINYRNYSLGEDIKKQTSQVSIFFKILPQVLESKDLEPNFQSLVKNIDNLNQTLEKNLNAENGELVGKLKERDIDLINKIFAEGYKKYQLKQFEEILGNQYNIVLNSLILLKAYTRLSLINSTTDLNTDFETTHKALLESYSLQNQSLENTNVEQKKKFSYSQDDLKKINELLSQPLILNSTNQDEEFKNKPNTLRSQTYLEFCSSYPEFKKGDITISKNKKIELNSEHDDYTFNLQNIAYRKGIDPNCELIDILGNLKEKKYNQIEFVTFENKIKDFDIVIDYLMKKIPFDSKEK